MSQNTSIQILMIVVIIAISLIFFLKYFKKDIQVEDELSLLKKVKDNNGSSSSYIEELNYISLDAKGNKYQITSKKTEIDKNNQEVMFLNDVIAYIFLKDSETVKITSDFGKYNSKNYDTIFSKNVIITYPNHKITGEYLDFSFLKNLGTMSINVVYTGVANRMIADRIEMNITTKDTRIFMDDNKNKVLIQGIR